MTLLHGLKHVYLTSNCFNISGTRIETPASCTDQGTSKYFNLLCNTFIIAAGP
jgi:hypothetical protein